MNKGEGGFELLKIQTVVLKVHIHCDGCKQEVKKLLQKIEGVYTVNIDAEQQLVTVSGDVDSSTLINKLARSGKRAELRSHKSANQSNHNKHQQQQGKDGKKKKNNNNDSSDLKEDGERSKKNLNKKLVGAAPLNHRMANNGLMGLEAPRGHGRRQAQRQLGANFSTGGLPANGNHQAPPPSMMMSSRGMNTASMADMSSNSMLMNESRYVQPQVMYSRSPCVPPYTGYYYCPYPYYQPLCYDYYHPEAGGGGDHGDHHGCSTDESSCSCVVM